MLRVVLDTNIVVSSVLSRSGPPARVMDAWREIKFILLMSPAILAEVRATLDYPRIRDKYAITAQNINELCQLFERHTLWVSGEMPVSGLRLADPKDEMFLICAVEGEADFVVSGDRHLLELGEFAGIAIVTARQFLQRLEAD